MVAACQSSSPPLDQATVDFLLTPDEVVAGFPSLAGSSRQPSGADIGPAHEASWYVKYENNERVFWLAVDNYGSDEVLAVRMDEHHQSKSYLLDEGVSVSVADLGRDAIVGRSAGIAALAFSHDRVMVRFRLSHTNELATAEDQDVLISLAKLIESRLPDGGYEPWVYTPPGSNSSGW
jgi:hypothetical protein